MKYFLYANIEHKPVMRFFNHWYEVIDFLKLMNWDNPKSLKINDVKVEIYTKMDESEIKEKL
jgi:hypothetical protein